MKKLRFIKTFENFANAPAPTKEPGVKPTVRPADPGTRPSRKSPIRRHKPAVDPKPKAELEDVLSLFSIQASDEQKKEIERYYDEKTK